MKDQSFVIKIADIINQPWKKDEITFEKKFTDQLPNLDENWLSWNVLLQSLDKNSILVSLIDVKWVLEDNCDICQKTYKRSILSELYKAKFIIPEYYKDDENSTEEIFPINHKDETINIEDMVVQDIVLQEPIVRRCKKCEKTIVQSDNIEEEDVDYFEWKWNIIFK